MTIAKLVVAGSKFENFLYFFRITQLKRSLRRGIRIFYLKKPQLSRSETRQPVNIYRKKWQHKQKRQIAVSEQAYWSRLWAHLARQNGDFGRNCPPISAAFGRNLGGKSQAWYPILHCTSPFRCFSDHMFTDSTYFPPVFRSFCAGPVLQGIKLRSPSVLKLT